jgi:hypothetical protein
MGHARLKNVARFSPLLQESLLGASEKLRQWVFDGGSFCHGN